MNAVGLVWANLHRRPVRTYLTLFSVLVAFLLFALLRTMAVLFSGSTGITAADRLVVSAKYSIIDPLPISQRSAIEAVDGVEAVTHQSWFGGIYQDRSNRFPTYPVEPRAYFDMYPEAIIAPEQLDAFERTRTGAVAPATFLERFGWQIGDKIPIEATIYPMRDGSRLWEFDLVGTYTFRDESSPESEVFLFHYDYFEQAAAFGGGTVGWYSARIADPDRAPEVAKAIDSLFENSHNPTKTATEDEFARAFAAQIGDIGLMANSILSAVFFTILLLTAVVMHWAFRERIAELAVLKTLGFSDRKVAAFVFGESVLLCAFGGVLGIGLAVVATQFPSATALMNQFGLGGLGFGIDWPTAAQGLAIAVLLGAVVGVWPAWLAGRLTIAEALRRR